MPNSPRSSNTSVTCRLDWRPSRLLGAALILLGIGAALAVLSSQMPRLPAWCLVGLAALHGGAAAWRWMRQPACHWVFRADGNVYRNGQAIASPRLIWRGPLAVLSWTDRRGRRRDQTWWPDTLPAAARRELRLAADVHSASRHPSAMAP